MDAAKSRRIHPGQPARRFRVGEGQTRSRRGDRMPRASETLLAITVPFHRSPKRRLIMAQTQKISTCLWFDQNAEEAANFYVSLFPDSRIVAISRNGDGGPGPEGSVLVVAFEIAGRRFMALNG